MRSWLRILEALDLASNGKPSFSKLICLTLVVACAWADSLTGVTVTALLAASFGRSMYSAFLHSRKERKSNADEIAASPCGNP
jgi:hypothetical protein